MPRRGPCAASWPRQTETVLKVDLLVVRVLGAPSCPQVHRLALSKPCAHCADFLRQSGVVHRVFYSALDGSIICEEASRLENGYETRGNRVRPEQDGMSHLVECC